MQEPIDQKRKQIVHDFAMWMALSALRSGSRLKRAEQVYDLIENHADWPLLFGTTRAIDRPKFAGSNLSNATKDTGKTIRQLLQTILPTSAKSWSR